MLVHWPNPPRSGAEVSQGMFVIPPGHHRIYAGAYADLTGGQDCSIRSSHNFFVYWGKWSKCQAFLLTIPPAEKRHRIFGTVFKLLRSHQFEVFGAFLVPGLEQTKLPGRVISPSQSILMGAHCSSGRRGCPPVASLPNPPLPRRKQIEQEPLIILPILSNSLFTTEKQLLALVTCCSSTCGLYQHLTFMYLYLLFNLYTTFLKIQSSVQQTIA